MAIYPYPGELVAHVLVGCIDGFLRTHFCYDTTIMMHK
jgi:hypothetical protein